MYICVDYPSRSITVQSSNAEEESVDEPKLSGKGRKWRENREPGGKTGGREEGDSELDFVSWLFTKALMSLVDSSSISFAPPMHYASNRSLAAVARSKTQSWQQKIEDQQPTKLHRAFSWATHPSCQIVHNNSLLEPSCTHQPATTDQNIQQISQPETTDHSRFTEKI